MNRKLVNGLLLLSVATVGCGTFTSCKDTDEDFKNEIILDQTQLRADLIKLIEKYRCQCDTALAKDLLEFAEANGWSQEQGDFANVMASWLSGKIGQDNYAYLTNASNKKLSDIAKDLYDLAVDVRNDSTAANDRIDSLKTRIEELEAKFPITHPTIDTTALHNQIVGLRNEIKGNQQDIVKLKSADSIMNIRLGKVINLAKKDSVRIDSLEKITTELRVLINANSDRLNKLITGIITQQTYNPIFGTLNLPIGLQSNIVANYYGYTDKQITFPFGGNTEYNADKSVLNNAALTAAIEKLGYTAKTYSGYYMDDLSSVNNLGNLYVTINPNNINFDGVTLSLVNSKDEEAPVVLKTSKENDKVLDFGFDLTRSAQNNGFYRSDVKVDPTKAPELAVRIESGLKSAMKDALLDHTKKDFVALGKVLFNQMNGILPAYALKAQWDAPANVLGPDGNYTTETQTFAVYSNYNIAAATVHPLGYEFLYGEGTNKEIPTFGSVKDALHDFFKDIRKDMVFNLDLQGVSGLKPEDINISLDGVSLKIDPTTITIDLNGTPIVVDGKTGEISGKDAVIVLGYDGTTVDPVGNANALNGVINSIVSAVNKMLSGKGDDSLTNQLNKQIREQIVGKVNDMVADINKMLVGDGTPQNPGINNQINDQIGTILDKIENQLAGKLDRVDKLVDKYNALVNKINNFLKNPNNYLQVMMAYSTGNGDLHHLSTTFNDATPFVKGSGNAITLYATSYTAELIAPSFKKFVAVTRAWNVNTNAEAPTVAKDVNTASKYLNEVRPGRQQQFGLTGLKSGYKYEIVYTSLDYRGYTSTRLYYLTVK